MEDLARIAYEAYLISCGGRSAWDGGQLPTWEEQSPEIRAHWDAAAQGVLRATMPEQPEVFRAFIVDTPDGERLASYAGNLIIATTPEEIGQGPSTHTTDLESRIITVSQWIKEHN
jgi:hypothetical protein